MQKFRAKLKNTPTDASQVCSSVNLPLNRGQSLSVVDDPELKDKLTLNNPEVNLAVSGSSDGLQPLEKSFKKLLFNKYINKSQAQENKIFFPGVYKK